MNNLPKVKIGIVAVSRDCFPASLAVNRRKALVEAYKAKYDAEDIYELTGLPSREWAATLMILKDREHQATEDYSEI